jgi:hypothetical protein
MGACEGTVRAVEALLQMSGGAVTLEIASPANDGTFEDITLAPCVFRRLGEESELLVAASAVAAAAGPVGVQVTLFDPPARVIADNVVWRVKSCAPMDFAGGVLCWRVQLVR